MFISFQNLLCLEDVEEGYLGPVQWEGRAITQVVGPSRWLEVTGFKNNPGVMSVLTNLVNGTLKCRKTERDLQLADF